MTVTDELILARRRIAELEAENAKLLAAVDHERRERAQMGILNTWLRELFPWRKRAETKMEIKHG